MDKLPVMEIFGPTVQGEGMLCGQISHFIRLGGCSYRCTWCDSMHAVDPELIHRHAMRMDQLAIAKSVNTLRPARWVTLSGGDPCMYDLEQLVVTLRKYKFNVAVETQGVHKREWLKHCQAITVSPKPPSSGMASRLNLETLDWFAGELGATVTYTGGPVLRMLSFKVVVFDTADLDWAQMIHRRHPFIPFYISCGTDRPIDENEETEETSFKILQRFRGLVSEVLMRPELSDVTVLPQMHALIWGHKKGV